MGNLPSLWCAWGVSSSWSGVVVGGAISSLLSRMAVQLVKDKTFRRLSRLNFPFLFYDSWDFLEFDTHPSVRQKLEGKRPKSIF